MRRRAFLGMSAAAMGAAVLRPGIDANAAPPSSQAAKIPVKYDKKLAVHPRLQYGAVAEPNRVVRVIVQRQKGMLDGGRIAASVGGRVREEFGAVGAHTMEVPLRDVATLARQAGVRYVMPDAPVHGTSQYDNTTLKTLYPQETHATNVWAGQNRLSATGKGVGVAVLDTGFSRHPDLAHTLTAVKSNPLASNAEDQHGHGTHLAGIIAGRNVSGGYIGIAPEANVIGVKISQDNGSARTSDLLRGLIWVYENREAKKIRVLNLSCSPSLPESYRSSIIAAALEVLWYSGITVVVSAGNKGSDPLAAAFSPANDPHLISVGALDSGATAALTDNSLISYSSRGNTQNGYAKPDVVAPGRHIYSTLASPTCWTALNCPPEFLTPDKKYVRLSGTSQAAPVVAGVVALLLDRFPRLTPNQVKAILTKSSVAYPNMVGGAKMVDAAAALALANTGNFGSANAGVPLSNWLSTGGNGGIQFNDFTWDDFTWDDFTWDDFTWDDFTWDDFTWDDFTWD